MTLNMQAKSLDFNYSTFVTPAAILLLATRIPQVIVLALAQLMSE